MKSSLARLHVGLFSLAVVGALGFGVSQAVASPATDRGATARNCSECFERCVVVKLCHPGYCQCG